MDLPPQHRRPKACIIGAGSSGLPAVKALLEAGVPFDCYEKSDRVGGLWVYENSNGLSGAYRGLNSNAPKGLMQYGDFPLPDEYPAYPSHWQFADYFQSYAEKFDLLRHITFSTGVESVRERADRQMEVTLDDGSVHLYDYVLVANGHHWDPKWPDPGFPGEFAGEQLHSHSYRTPASLAGKRVAVVGIGNSAMDIASEASVVADRTFLSVRTGVPITPKYFFGKAPPVWVFDALSFRLGRRAMELAVKLVEGPPERYGLPAATCALGETHPSGSDQLFTALRRGRITPKPNIESLDGDQVRFTDGTVETVDVIVYCTGYWISFPFFERGYIAADENQIGLFKHVFDPDHPGVFFIGLTQPIGSIQPLAEQQSKWVAQYLTGGYLLPSTEEMRHDIERDRRWRDKRFVKSTRNTIEVDHRHYRRAVRAEVKAGERRAAKGSGAR